MNEHTENGMGQSPDGQAGGDESPHGDDRSSGADNPGWRATGEEFDYLRDSFRSSYQEGAGDGPSRQEVTDALRTLAGAVSHMVAGAGNTLRDPAVKQQVKKTSQTAMTTMAAVFAGWSDELRSRLEERRDGQQSSSEEQSPPEATASQDETTGEMATAETDASPAPDQEQPVS